MELPPSQYQASIPSTFSAPTLKSRVLHTTTASTITSISIQPKSIYVSTLLGNTIQTGEVYSSTIIGNNIGTDTLLTYSMVGNLIQTDSLVASLLSGSTIQTNTFHAISLKGSTIQTNTCDTQIVSSNTIQVNGITTSTVTGNIIQTNTHLIGTVICSTIQSSTLKINTLYDNTTQSNIIKVSSISGSIFQHNQLYTNIIKGNTLFTNVFYPTTLQLSTMSGTSIESNIIQGSTFQTNKFNYSTLIGSTVQAHAINISTLPCNIIIGCTIQVNTVSSNIILASNIQGNQLNVSTLIGSTIQINTGTISTIQYSTILGNTIQTSIIQASTIAASTIQSNILQMSTLIGSIIQISTLNISSLRCITIQTNKLNISTLSGSTIQINTLQVSTLSGSTIKTKQLNISTLVCSTIQTDRLDGSTILFSTIKTNTIYISTIRSGTIIGGTIQTPILQVSTISCSTIIGNNFQTNKTLITDGNNTLSTSESNMSQLQYLTNLTSNVGGLGQTNTWTASQIFSTFNIYFTGLASEPMSTIVGLNSLNQLVRYPQRANTEILGELTQNYILYASTSNILTNSIIYRVNATDIAIGQTTSAFPTGTGTTFSVAGRTQATHVITETGKFSKIVMADKRGGLNGLQIPGNQGCNFYMGTMNNNGSGSYTDTLYLNSVPTINTSDSYNIRNNIIVTSAGTGFETMTSFTTPTTGLTFSILLILTGSTMPTQWARIFDIGDISQAPTRGFQLYFNSNRTIGIVYRSANTTVVQIDATIQLALNTMYHIVWTINTSGNHVLYINGQQAATMTLALTVYTHPYFYLGRSNWSGDSYPNMTIFDFRMMNRSLIADDITGLYYSIKNIRSSSVISGQYIILNRSTLDTLNLAEIQAFSYEGGPNIITPSASITFQGQNTAWPLSNFVDGNFNNFIHSNDTTNPLITINLGSTHPIFKIVIYNRADCCLNRANGIVLMIQSSNNTTVYTSSPIPDKLGQTTVNSSQTANLTDYYNTFTYFPPYAAVIGNFENTESSACKTNVVMFNKSAPGMRIYQGLNQATANYTTYKDLLMTDTNSGNITIGAGSDTDGITFGPSFTTSSYLKIGSGINRIGTNIAQVITTNGNLHLDCGTNSKSIKINSSNTSFATFIGGPINIHSLQFDQNVSSFSNIVYNETNKLCKSESKLHIVKELNVSNWAGGVNILNAFYKSNDKVAIKITGRYSFFKQDVGDAYAQLRLYSKTSGQYFYFDIKTYISVGGTRLTCPIDRIISLSSPGWYDIYFSSPYSWTNMSTDGNDQLYIYVRSLPGSSWY